ncbi:MAG: HlyD family efflux transporter periplasmic adaptor subunit [Candidatus Nanopelagicales bacterium]
MTDQNEGNSRRQSDVLDAIFDAVEEKPEQGPRAGSNLFRVKALEQIDISTQLDNLLPITSRKLWISLIAVVLVLAGGLVYAGGVTQISSVSAAGRVVQSDGIAVAAAPTDLLLAQVLVNEGKLVAEGQVLGKGIIPGGDQVSIVAPVDGTVWQILGTLGRVSPAGEAVMSILPAGSESNVLIALPESDAAGVALGQVVEISSSAGTRTGEVSHIDSAPIPAEIASERTGSEFPAETPMIMIDVTLDEQLDAGSSVNAEIIESERTLLNQLVNVG